MRAGAGSHLRPPPHLSAARPRLGFGAWAVGGAGWGDAGSRADRLTAVRRALELSVTFFDTAPTYGESEALLGEGLRGARDRVEIATKAGPRDDPRASLEASLRRLGVERVDLFQLHEVAEGFESRLERMTRLRDEGKTRALGICNATPRELARALEVAPVETHQGPYNLVDRDAEQRLLPLCRDRGVGFLAYRPLASGLLAGKHEAPPEFAEGDHRRRAYWFRGREFERRRRVVQRLRDLAAVRGTSVAAVALAWALGRPGVSVVLAGARSTEQVEENVEAARRPLEPDEAAAVETAVADAFRPPRAVPEALARDWGERERFIVERLDGAHSYEEIAAAWSDAGDPPMIGAQVKVFADDLAERGLVTSGG